MDNGLMDIQPKRQSDCGREYLSSRAVDSALPAGPLSPRELILGYEAAQIRGRDQPVFVTESLNDCETLLGNGLPAIAALSDWSEEHAEHIAGWTVCTVFTSRAFKRRFSKAVSSHVYDIRELESDGYTSLSTFMESKARFDDLHAKSFEARPYDHRDEDFAKGKASFISAADLMAKEFEPLRWIVKDILPEGLTLLAGPPKLGKSWLGFDLALSVAFGRPIFGGLPVKQGDVLLLALEDGPRRIKSRFQMLAPEMNWNDARLTIESTASRTPFPALDNGGLEYLESWLEGVDDGRLIVIDVLQKVRPEQKGNESEYSALYRSLRDIHSFAVRNGISVLVVHHTRKSGSHSGDPFEKVSGSMAFTALPDATLILDHSTSPNCDAYLYGRGRDLEEFELALDFHSGFWTIVGDVEAVERSQERQEVLKHLKAAPAEGFSAPELAQLVGKSENTMRQLLGRMVKAKEAERFGRGRYMPVQRL